MPHDIHGLPISTSAAGAAAFDQVLMGYLKFRADAGQRLADTLAVDGEFALAHCIKGYFAMLSYKQANMPIAEEAAQNAPPTERNATPREQAHAAALDAWIAGDLDRTIGIWEQILGRASARCARVSPRALQQFLARPAARDARLGRARAAEVGARPAGLRHDPVLPLFFARGMRRLRERRSSRAAPRSRSTRAMSGARTRLRTSWKCRGATEKASRGSMSLSAIGMARPTSCIICGGTARCFISSGASSTRCSISTTGASEISAARSRSHSPTFISTCRMPPRCCFGSNCSAFLRATAGTRSPTRPRHASATAFRPSRCRTG